MIVRPIGYTIRRLRHERGLTINAAAKLAGVYPPVLGKLERDTYSNPTLATLTGLARAFDLTLAQMIREWEIDQIEVVSDAA